MSVKVYVDRASWHHMDIRPLHGTWMNDGILLNEYAKNGFFKQL